MASPRIWATSLLFSSATVLSSTVGVSLFLDAGRARGLEARGIGRASEPRAMRAATQVPPSSIFVPLGLPASAPFPDDVRRVVRAAREAGPDAAPELRRAALDSGDPLIAGNAIRALGRVGALSGDIEVTGLLTDSRPRVRQEVVLALGSSRDPRSLDDLVAVLDDDDVTMRVLAIRSIGRIGGPAARDALESAGTSAARTEVERAFVREALEKAR